MKEDIYQITISPVEDRRVIIEREKVASTRTHRFYEFRDEVTDLPIVRLPIELPIYRVANYRTSILQLNHIKEKALSDTYFLTGEENLSVQQLQHQFLWGLAQMEKESVKSIKEILQDEEQKQPLLITVTGVVVNGNRRIAAMRQLKYSHVDCMVLPANATEDDLKDIEVRLQMTPETRLPYGWVNECLAINDLYHRGRSIEKISDLMRIDEPKVRDKLLMLTEIELYLKDWKRTPQDYDQLSDAEEIISQVASKLKKKEGVNKEIARHIAWILLDQRGKEGRVYELRETTGTLTQSVVEKIQEVYSSEIAEDDTESSEDLEFDLSGGAGQNKDGNIINFFVTCRDNDQKQEEIINICRSVVEAKKNTQAGNLALKFVTEANARLIQTELSTADKSTYSGIKKQLQTIKKRVDFLFSELDRIEAKKN